MLLCSLCHIVELFCGPTSQIVCPGILLCLHLFFLLVSLCLAWIFIYAGEEFLLYWRVEGCSVFFFSCCSFGKVVEMLFTQTHENAFESTESLRSVKEIPVPGSPNLPSFCVQRHNVVHDLKQLLIGWQALWSSLSEEALIINRLLHQTADCRYSSNSGIAQMK